MSDLVTCGFAGNPDIYGIGIRIGFYTQAAAAWFASFFLASEARTSQDTNRLFMIAIGVVVIWYAANNEPSRYAVELWSMGLIASSTRVVSQQRLTRYSSRYVPFSLTQMGISRLVGMGMAAFGTWFWWAGLDDLQPTPCGTYVFFFAKLDMYGWFRTFAKVACAIWILQMLLDISSWIHYVKLYRRVRETKCAFISGAQAAQDAANSKPRQGCRASTKTGFTIKVENVRSNNSGSKGQQLVGILQGVQEAEKYLASALTSDRSANTGPKAGRPFSSYRTGFWHLLTFFWTQPQLRGVWDVLAFHFQSERRKPVEMLNLVNRMIELDRQGATVDFRILKIASDVRLSQQPLYTTQGWVTSIVLSLATTLFAILAIELTIAWNHISGLNEIFSVGQLVPFVIGIGGLLQVLWRKWRSLERDHHEEAESSEDDPYQLAISRYLDWKREKVPQSGLMGRAGDAAA